MVPSDLAARLRLLSETFVQPISPVREIPTDLPEFTLGQRFTARIEAVLPDGNFRALVAGRNLTLSLPQSARPGDTLDLVVTDRTERLIVAQGAEVAASDQRAATTTLSRTARLIGSLLADAASGLKPVPLQGNAVLLPAPPAVTPLPPRPAIAVRQEKPAAEPVEANAAMTQTAKVARMVVAGGSSAPDLATQESAPAPSPPPGSGARTDAVPQESRVAAISTAGPAASSPAAPLAAALRTAILESGLFYESHQALWISGRHSLDALKREPQARLARATDIQRAATQGQTEAVSAEQTIPSVTASPEEAAPASRPATIVPGELQPLVQKQFDVAATQQVFWQGEIWPGQVLQWDIAEETPSDRDTDPSSGWRISLLLKMPRIGEIEVTMRLAAQGVMLKMAVPPGDGAEALSINQSALADALAAAGMPLLSMSVDQHEPA